MAKMKEFFLVSYLDHETIQNILDTKLNQIDRYAYILHDRDVYDKDIVNDVGDVLHAKGDSKEPHTHIYLKLFESRQADEIQRWFVREVECKRVNCFVERVHNRVGCIAYLTHSNKKAQHKFQYPIDSMVSFNLDGSELGNECVDESLDIIEDILGGVSYRDLLCHYGRQIVYHIKDYKYFADLIKREQNQNND